MRPALAAVLGLLLAAGPLAAQTPGAGRGAPPAAPAGNGEVKGTVVDLESGAAVARASVAVRTGTGAATTVVAGALAAANGTFRVQGLRAGAYTVRVTFLGFTPKVQQVTISAAAPVVDLGTIRLARAAVALGAVDVVERPDMVTIEPDRNTYRAKDVAPAATNASEVLEATPSVTVDADGKVSLRGNENVAVQINGRPAPISGAQLGAYLKSLPAGLLDRVEVVPNPSAKYDPEGMAGIINIVLKQNVDLGLSGGLTVGAASRDKYNASGNVGYQAGRLTTFANVGVFGDGRDVVGINDRLRYDAVKALLSATEQDIDGTNGFRGQNFGANVDYKLNARDVLSNALQLNHRDATDAARTDYSELDGSRTVTDRYLRPRDNDSRGTSIDYTSAFKRTFAPRTHELSAELRFNHSHDEDATALWRESIASDGARSGSPVQRETDNTDAVTKQLTAQLDYTRPLGKAKLETGYKGTTRWLDRDYLVLKDSLGDGQWTRSDLSNAFSFDERVQAAYGVVSRPIGKLEAQAGVRAEYASRDFSLAGERYPYHHTSFFPSGVLSWNLSGTSQAKVSYSRRIRRPGTQELNPFPTFFDVQNVFIGNPALNPEYTDAYELGYTRSGKFGSIQLSPFFRHTTNVIRFIINTDDVVDGREVTTISFKNLARSDSWGTDINGSLRFGKRFNGFAGGNVFKLVTDGGTTTSVAGTDAVTWSTRFNGTFDVTPTLSVQGFYMYRAPMKIEGGKFSAMQFTNVTLRRKLDGDHASVSLRVSDPFNTGHMRVQAGDETLTQITERSFGNRAAYLTFQWNYGQTPRVRQPKPEENQGGGQGGGFGG
ncbi:MAG TPA: TonB-dependent receptor [Gemmatimonadaceae bacterium]|nr:TonB-dependent receptor [Gemmatimonadaceae bacterium]